MNRLSTNAPCSPKYSDDVHIAAHVKKDKMSYQHEAVHINGGPGCK
jgi:hypothetical protein